MTSTVSIPGEDAVVSKETHTPLQGQKRPQSGEEGNSLECDESLQPPPAKRVPGPSTTNSSEDESSVSSEVELESPVNECDNHHTQTAKSTKWALNHFTRWQEERNARFADGDTENQVPADLLIGSDPQLLSKWLGLYAAEARKLDGKMFPASTVYFLLAGLVRHMRTVNPTCPNFLHTSNVQFKSLHDSLDETFRRLKADCTVVKKGTAEPFSREEEERLWSSGALSTDTRKGLLRAVFFHNSRNFGVIGGNKHRQLKLSQLKRVAHPPRYVYTFTQEPISVSLPSQKHSFPSLKKKSESSSSKTPLPAVEKTIIIDAAIEKGNRCHVHVLDLYLQKIPPEAFEKDNFYLQPSVDHQKHWYLLQPLGKNSLSRMVKDICTDAGIRGERTIRAGYATGLAGVCESVPACTSPQGSIMPPPQLALPPLSYLMLTSHILHNTTTEQPTTSLALQNSTNPRPTTAPTLQGPAGRKLLPKLPQIQQPQNAANQQPATIPTPTVQLPPKLPQVHPSTTHNATNQQLGTVQAPIILPRIQQPTTTQSATNQQPATVSTPTAQLPPKLPQVQQPTVGSRGANNQPQTTPRSPINSPMQGYNPLQAIPQQLSFTNCHVTIYVTPHPPPPNT